MAASSDSTVRPLDLALIFVVFALIVTWAVSYKESSVTKRLPEYLPQDGGFGGTP